MDTDYLFDHRRQHKRSRDRDHIIIKANAGAATVVSIVRADRRVDSVIARHEMPERAPLIRMALGR